MNRFIFCFALIILIFLVSLTLAEIPKMINYQGMLTDNFGNPLTDTTVNITFKICDDSTGRSIKWEETQNNVSVKNGLFNVILGSVTPIDTLSFNQDYWLDITVGAEHMPSRLKFTSVGYAYRAKWAERSDTADYALSSPSGPGDYTWTFRITDTSDTTITTGSRWGIARFGNVLHGNADSTHINLGVACTTGTSGQGYKWCTVSGGIGNTASFPCATVGGGAGNTAFSSNSTVGGGFANNAGDFSSSVGGGYQDTASGEYATVSGGFRNVASGGWAFIGGGANNRSSGSRATVGGGESNFVSGLRATVSGGYRDTATGEYSIVGGGYDNTGSGKYSTSGGGYGNTASGQYSAIGGGKENLASGDSAATVGGGKENTANGVYATVGGGFGNTASGGNATAGGGVGNNATGLYATVAGGYYNIASDQQAIIGGGYRNCASGSGATIAGGYADTVSAIDATIAGGSFNRVSGGHSSIGGGYSNYIASQYSTIPGGYRDTLTDLADYSLAFGRSVYVNDDYYVVFFDSLYSGHFQLNRDHQGMLPTGYPIRIGTNITNGNGAYLTGGGVWTDGSSRSKKENFEELDGVGVLDKIENMPVTRWNFKGTEERHIGPVAEDFYRAFGCGTGIPEDDSTYISAKDIAGVSLVAIQELSRMVKEQQKEIEILKMELENMKSGGR